MKISSPAKLAMKGRKDSKGAKYIMTKGEASGG